MKTEDKSRFKLAMHLFEITFNADFDNAKLAGYFMALEDLQIDSIEAAVKESIKLEKRTPPPAVIREYANKFRRPVEPDRQISQFIYKDVNSVSQFGKDSLDLIRQLFDGEINKKDYLYKAIQLCDLNDQESTDLQSQWSATATQSKGEICHT